MQNNTTITLTYSYVYYDKWNVTCNLIVAVL